MRKMSLDSFLGALSITSATDATWRLLMAEGYDTLDKIKTLTVAQVAEAGRSKNKTIGYKRAIKIVGSLTSVRIQGYLQHAEQWIDTEVKTIQTKIDIRGKKVVFTGKGPMGRKELTQLLENSGAIVQSAVSSNTDILLLEDENSTSSKAVAARKLGVTIYAYNQVI